MYEAILIAATGLTNQQRRIDTIADNVANVNTVGFKATRLDFKDALYSSGYGPAAAPAPAGNQQKGHGVMVASITRFDKQGSMLVTDNPLDFTIEGDGFLEVKTQSGAIRYTKSGNLYTATYGDELVMTTAQGYLVQSTQGTPVSIPKDTTGIRLEPDGNITFLGADADGEQTELGKARLGFYSFSNTAGLSASGGSLFEATAASGEKQEARGALRQGALEASNVDLSLEMTRLIRAQRAFSLAGRALRTADDMEGIANNLRR